MPDTVEEYAYRHGCEAGTSSKSNDPLNPVKSMEVTGTGNGIFTMPAKFTATIRMQAGHPGGHMHGVVTTGGQHGHLVRIVLMTVSDT